MKSGCTADFVKSLFAVCVQDPLSRRTENGDAVARDVFHGFFLLFLISGKALCSRLPRLTGYAGGTAAAAAVPPPYSVNMGQVHAEMRML